MPAGYRSSLSPDELALLRSGQRKPAAERTAEEREARSREQAAYDARPEVKARKAAYYASTEVKAREAACRARPEVKARKAAHMAAYRAANREAILARNAARTHREAQAANISSPSPRMTPAMLEALDAEALKVASEFGLDVPMASNWLTAASIMFADPTCPYYQDPRLALFKRGNANNRLKCWRNGGTRRPYVTRPKRCGTTVETGIYRVATFRKDGGVTVSWEASAGRCRAAFPTIHLARAWRHLAREAQAQGLPARSVRRDPYFYDRLLADGPPIREEPMLPAPVHPDQAPARYDLAELEAEAARFLG
jgi:hypothetical protein